MRRSLCRAASACARTRTDSVLITTLTSSITPKVTTYWVSATARVRCGGTKKKSNAATLRRAASTEGPRPYREATNATPSR